MGELEMWKKISESSNAEISEEEVYKELESVYRKLESIHSKLTKSTDIELRKKYLRPIVDFLNWMDYEI